MERLLKLALFIPLISLLAFHAYGQNEQTEFLKGKQYFSEGNYRFAMDYFRRLSGANQTHQFRDYAAFYYALSAYYEGEKSNAKAMWLQMSERNINWSQIREVHYWLAELYFDEGDYLKGVEFAKKSGMEQAKVLMNTNLVKVDSLPVLEQIYKKFPQDALIGTTLANAINDQPISSRNFRLLNELVNKFDLNVENYGMPEIGESKMKSAYNIAILMPFMFDDIDNTFRVERNKFIMDLYAGMMLAVDTLTKQDTKLNIFPYDTKRDVKITEQIFKQPEMKSMDLIVGPLFPGPLKIANDFSYEHEINMINPLITSSDVIENNPFSFLFKASTENQALAAAEMVIDSIKNKYAMVFYEHNEKDSLSAYTYSKRIQEAGFEVLINAGVVDTTVRQAYDLLTEKYEVGYSKFERDSIMESDETREIQERKSSIKKDSIEYYEEFFTIAPDSIGHIYVASSKALFASSFISAMSIRADSTQLIGRGNWKSFPTLTFEEMERLGIYFIDPEYINTESPSFKVFRDNYLKQYKSPPSINSIVGYEMIYYLGNMLKNYGHYFQKGHLAEGFVPGQLLQGTEYNFRNSNQYVPITILSNSKLKLVNAKNNGQNQ